MLSVSYLLQPSLASPGLRSQAVPPRFQFCLVHATSLLLVTPDLLVLGVGGGYTVESWLSRSLISTNSSIGLKYSQGSSLSSQDRLGCPVTHTAQTPLERQLHRELRLTAASLAKTAQLLTPALPKCLGQQQPPTLCYVAYSETPSLWCYLLFHTFPLRERCFPEPTFSPMLV